MSLQQPLAREKNAVALSCQSCKTRKIRCDKGSPCSACTEHGRDCVPIIRARLPRGRTKDKKDASGELKARLARLESLVSSLKGANGDQGDSSNGVEEPAHQVNSQLDSLSIGPTPSTSNAASVGHSGEPDWQWIANSHRWLGSTLWTQLGEQINGIHAVLEADEAEDDQSPGPGPIDGGIEQDWSILGNSPSSFSYDLSSEPPSLSDHSKQAMIHLWVRRVDPVMKLIHEPSFTAYLQGTSDYLNYAPGHVHVEALRAAVLYCCVCSITESESFNMFGTTPDDLINTWRRYTEQCFAKADYMISRDVTMLQAMIYYLVRWSESAAMGRTDYRTDSAADP